MTKHTPGPWTVIYAPDTGFTIWHDPRLHGDKRRGAVIIAADLRAGPETEANARLIAAAPDMLAALREMVGFVGTNGHALSMVSSGTWNAARWAIAKAEGV
jgi:hypothetical protein